MRASWPPSWAIRFRGLALVSFIPPREVRFLTCRVVPSRCGHSVNSVAYWHCSGLTLCLGLASEEPARSLEQSSQLTHFLPAALRIAPASPKVRSQRLLSDWITSSPTEGGLTLFLLQPIGTLLSAARYHHLSWLWNYKLSLIVSRRGKKFPWNEF